jgi:hypothetical protein
MAHAGSQELVIGVGASRRFGLKSGDTLLMPVHTGRAPLA